MEQRNLRVVRVCAASITFETLLHDQMIELSRVHDVSAVAELNDDAIGRFESLGIPAYSVYIPRAIDPIADIRAIRSLGRLFKALRPDIVHSVTPKAGLLTMCAAVLTRVPHRLHTYTGQVWETAEGRDRFLLKLADRVTAALATDVYCDSPSQRSHLDQERVVREARCTVLGAGSLSGVDLERFDPAAIGPGQRRVTRERFGIPDDGFVVLFLGRLSRDKGIDDLVEAFSGLSPALDATLVLAGPMDDRDPITRHTVQAIRRMPNVVETGFVDDAEQLMAVSDVLCIPSRREGFGSVVVEAGAMELPVIATRATGLVDAVVDGVTGLLVDIDDVEGLHRELERLARDDLLRSSLGEAGRKRAVQEFDSKRVNRLVSESYLRLRQ